MIEQIQNRIKEYEQAIANSPMGAALSELRHMLEVATTTAEVVAPESDVTKALEAVDKVVKAASK